MALREGVSLLESKPGPAPGGRSLWSDAFARLRANRLATGSLVFLVLMAIASLSVVVFFVRRGAAGAQSWRLVTSALAGIALVVIAGYTVKDFDVLVGAGPDSSLSWILPGIIGLALVVGLVQGAVLRARAPEKHARIGLGNEAFQLEKEAERTS